MRIGRINFVQLAAGGVGVGSAGVARDQHFENALGDLGVAVCPVPAGGFKQAGGCQFGADAMLFVSGFPAWADSLRIGYWRCQRLTAVGCAEAVWLGGML